MWSIVEAAKEGDIDAVKKFLSSGTNVDEMNERGDTAFICACMEGHLEICKFLVESGANIKHQNKLKNTPLILAADKNESNVVKYILEHVDEDHVNHVGIVSRAALHWAARSAARIENVKLVKMLLEKGANPYLIDENNRNAIDESTRDVANFIRSFHFNKIITEIQKDLNEIKTKTMEGNMNIKRAARLAVVLFLLVMVGIYSNGASWLKSSRIETMPSSATPVEYTVATATSAHSSIKDDATNHGNKLEEIVCAYLWTKWLKRVSPSSPAVYGSDAIGSDEIIGKKDFYSDLLLARDEEKELLIHSAVQYGYKEDIEAAVEANQADKLKLTIVDSQGRTAMDLAALTGQLDVVEFLMRRGGVFHKHNAATMMAIARTRAAGVDAYLDFARSTLKEYK